MRTLIPQHPAVVPAVFHERRARRVLLGEWGVPDEAAFLRLMLFNSPVPEAVWCEESVVTADGRVHILRIHELPDPARRWPPQYQISLYGVSGDWPLEPAPPVIGLAQDVEVRMHVLRVVGGYKDSTVYVEFCQHPDGETGPDLRGLALDTAQDELLRAWTAVQFLRNRTRPGPRPWPLAKKIATLDDFERRLLAYRPATGLHQWRWTQEKLGLAVGVARETAIDRLKRCLGKGGPDCWLAVQEWADTLPLKKVKPEDLPEGGHLRDLLGK